MGTRKRLTEYSACAGWASKLAAGELAHVLSDLPGPSDARVLIDYRTADDAGVYAIDTGLALVQTVDFFTPIVDDPEAYGAIAAANALSDVYAMGGTPITALAVAGFPVKDFDPADIKAVFAGGHAKLREAGVALLGGHTVQDTEVKFGYAVTGLVDPRRLWANTAGRAGDTLLLTKPLGTGIITTALKHGRAPDRAVTAAVDSMRALNRVACEVLSAAGEDVVSACTDVTGFGLVGHASEMAGDRLTMAIDADALPLLPDVLDLSERNRPGGTANNQQHFGPGVERARALESALEGVLFDPQTSGGLLVAVASDRSGDVRKALEARGVNVWRVGEVLPRREGVRVLLR